MNIVDRVRNVWHSLYPRRTVPVGQPVSFPDLGIKEGSLRFKALAEFERLVPLAFSKTEQGPTAIFDFVVNGKVVAVRTSTPHLLSSKSISKSWTFLLNDRAHRADYICCFGFSDKGRIESIFLIDSPAFAGMKSIGVACSGRSRWATYEVKPNDLGFFFKLPEQA